MGDAHNWESGAKLVGRTAIPALLGAAGGMAGSIEGGPIGGFAGSKAGNMVGNEIVNQIGGTIKSQLSNAYDKIPVELHHPLEDLGRAGIDLAGFGLKSKAMEIYDKIPKELHPVLEMLAERAEQEIGSGVRRRGRPRKKGGDLASTTEPYKQAMSIKGIVNDNNVINNAPVSKYRTNPKVKKNHSTEMTLSPYQHASSPAMNPFKPSSYTQLGGTSQGVGSEVGRGLY